MFTKGNFRKEITPKRVFVLLKLIGLKNGELKEEEIFNYIQPDNLMNDQSVVKLVLNFCKEEELIEKRHNLKYYIKIDEKYIGSQDEFKKYALMNLFKDTNGKNIFFEITEEMLTLGLGLYEISSFDEIGNSLITPEARKEAMLCWRFWAEFLGYGFTLNSQFVMNPYLRIKYIIEERYKNKTEKKILLKDFLSDLKGDCPEFISSIKNNELSLPLSLALLTLDKLNVINIINIQDIDDIWKLKIDDIRTQYKTHIEILGGRNDK